MQHWRKTKEIGWTESPIDKNRNNQLQDLWTFRHCPHLLVGRRTITHVCSQPSDRFHLSHTILTVELVLKQTKTSFIQFLPKSCFGRLILCLFSALRGKERTLHGSVWIFCACAETHLHPSVSHQLFPPLVLSFFFIELPMVIANPQHPHYCLCCGAMTAAEWWGAPWWTLSLSSHWRLNALKISRQKAEAWDSYKQEPGLKNWTYILYRWHNRSRTVPSCYNTHSSCWPTSKSTAEIFLFCT